MNIDLKKEFEEKYNPIFIEDIYPGHPEKEQYFLVLDGTERDIEPQYSEVLEQYRPFVIISSKDADLLLECEHETKSLRNRVNKHETFCDDDVLAIIANNENMLESSPEETLEEMERKKKLSTRVRESIKKLPEMQRRRVVERFYRNMTMEEIARFENVSEPAVQKSIKLALSNLKNMLETCTEEI